MGAWAILMGVQMSQLTRGGRALGQGGELLQLSMVRFNSQGTLVKLPQHRAYCM